MGALKTLLYRARAFLVNQIGELPLILSQRGSYSWNPEISCEVDVERFESLCHQAQNAAHPLEERLALYREALPLYRGDFLPRLSAELWVIPLTTYYHSLFLQAIHEFGGLLLESGKYSELIDAATRALKVDALDEELYCLLVEGYLREGNISAALSHYETAVDQLYRNFGIRPSSKLRGLYQEIMKERKLTEIDLSVIQEGLREHAGTKGAFVCEYGVFKEFYRLESRRAARDGNCIHIGLFTVSSVVGEVPPLEVLNPVMDRFLEFIRSNLRRGDVVSRYSVSQYVLMLPTANFEDGELVMDRIMSDFSREPIFRTVRITYQLRQLELAR